MRRKQIGIAIFSLAALLCCAIVSMMPACNGDQRILSGIVDSSTIIHSVLIRHGVDTIRAFELRGDQETVDQIVAAWNLEAVTEDGKMSFLTNDAPSWWHNSSGDPDWKRYSHADESLERYWSVWYLPGTGSVFIETGQW